MPNLPSTLPASQDGYKSRCKHFLMAINYETLREHGFHNPKFFTTYEWCKECKVLYHFCSWKGNHG